MSWLVPDGWLLRAVLASMLVALACAPVGVFLYLRRQSLLVDALAHVALPGIVFAVLLTGSLAPSALLVGAVVTGLFTTWSIEALSRLPRIRPDAAIGVVFTSLFALGLLLLSSRLDGVHLDVEHALYGDVLAVGEGSFILLWCVTPVLLALIALALPTLSLASFDERYAASLGVPVVGVHYALTSSATLATVASFEAVGAVLVVAFVIVPAATAHIVARSVAGMIAWAVGFAWLAVACGVALSLVIDASTSGAIVACAGVIYLLVFLFAPRYGWLTSGR